MTTVFHTWPYDRFTDTEQPNSINQKGGIGGKMSAWGGFKEFKPSIFARQAYYVSYQKKTFKYKILL